MVDEVSRFEGDITSRTGSILASWFTFNPNGPTAYAVGYMEEADRLRFFCRWMHFTGGVTYVLDDLTVSDGLTANFAALSLGALMKLNNHMIMSSSDDRPTPGTASLPSFVKSNGNSEIDECLRHLLANGPAAHATDWGRELYYLQKYGCDLFGRSGEETRDRYEELKRESQTDPNISKEFLEFTWHRHAHLATFQNWRAGSYRSQPYSEAAFEAWWSTISRPDFVREGLAQFAHAWVGGMQFIQGGEFFNTLQEERLTDFDDVVAFFDAFHLPLYPPNWNIKADAGRLRPEKERRSTLQIDPNDNTKRGFEAYRVGHFHEAERLYRLAAEAGVADAQYNLAQMYFSGEGVPRDLPEAALWFERAATQGLAPAQHNIALAYDEGYGVGIDKAKAACWYEKAASRGMLNSMQNLGLMYAHGEGLPQDYERALFLFVQAANGGLPDAQQSAAASYANGWGAEPDLVEALKWCEVLSLRGFDAPYKQKLEARMTPEQVLDARSMAKEWLTGFQQSS